jgi:hypothetical protein
MQTAHKSSYEFIIGFSERHYLFTRLEEPEDIAGTEKSSSSKSDVCPNTFT